MKIPELRADRKEHTDGRFDRIARGVKTRWKQKTFDIGDFVQCDLCGATADDSMVGGFIFSSNAVCPICAPSMMEDIKKYGEESYIKLRAEPGETFKAMVLRHRGGNNEMTITSWGPGEPGPYPWSGGEEED